MDLNYTEDWVLTLIHEGQEYRVVWARLTAENDGAETHQLLVIRDGEMLQRSDDLSTLKDAVTAFRISQLQKEYNIDPFTILSETASDDAFGFDLLDDDLLDGDLFDETPEPGGVEETSTEEPYKDDELTRQQKEAIVSLTVRASEGEFLGQYDDESLYLQTAARILQTPESTISQLAHQLVRDSQIGLAGGGVILVPFSENDPDVEPHIPGADEFIGW
jgi:hypothetical protein